MLLCFSVFLFLFLAQAPCPLVCSLFFLTVSEMSTEDFVCTIRSDTETEHTKVANSLSASVKEARRDPETGIVTLTLNVVCAPLRPCRLQYYTSTLKYTQWPLCLVHLASTGLDLLLPLFFMVLTMSTWLNAWSCWDELLPCDWLIGYLH